MKYSVEIVLDGYNQEKLTLTRELAKIEIGDYRPYYISKVEKLNERLKEIDCLIFKILKSEDEQNTTETSVS